MSEFFTIVFIVSVVACLTIMAHSYRTNDYRDRWRYLSLGSIVIGVLSVFVFLQVVGV